MPAFCATVFVVFCSLIVSTCNGLLFNVSRGAQNVGSLDLFSNLDPSAKCPNSQSYPQAGRSWCLARKGNCSSQGCCMCMCRHSSATFQMKLNPNLATCVGNKDIRLFAGKFMLLFATCHVFSTLLHKFLGFPLFCKKSRKFDASKNRFRKL